MIVSVVYWFSARSFNVRSGGAWTRQAEVCWIDDARRIFFSRLVAAEASA
jgi:hypothetical protein